MHRAIFFSALLLFGLDAGPAAAAFPPKLTVRFKEKTSCRDAKKLLRPQRLFVDCQANAMRQLAYSADYFGREPVQKVISAVAANGRVLEIALSTDSQEAPETALPPATSDADAEAP
jgi:hypothetical protein